MLICHSSQADRDAIESFLNTNCYSFRDFDVVMRSLSDAWNRANHWSTRRQILAIIAGDLHSYVIREYFSGVTDWQIKIARRHAYSTGKNFFVFA